MTVVTPIQCLEIVEELRTMAAAASTAEVQAALTRLADRYAAMAVGSRCATQLLPDGIMRQ
jgi:hypothetical protein